MSPPLPPLQVAGMPDVLILTGNVEGGVPPFQPPWLFGLNATAAADGGPQEGPLEIARHLGVGLAMMPLVANLQQLAIAKFYTRELPDFRYVVKLNMTAHVGASCCTRVKLTSCLLLFIMIEVTYSDFTNNISL